MQGRQAPELRRVYGRTIAAFAATLTGLVGMTLLSLVEVRGLADRSLFIAEHAAAAVAQVSIIRGAALTARTAARDAVEAPEARRHPLREQANGSLAAMEKLFIEHQALHADAPTDDAAMTRAWKSFQEKQRAILDTVERGETEKAKAMIEGSREDYLHFVGILQADVARHNNDAHQQAIGVNDALRQFMSGIAVLTIIGMFGALVLLWLAVRSVRVAVASLDARNEAAEQRAAELDAFAGRVAHDLRGPLTAMKVTLSFAAKHADEGMRTSLRRANESIDVLNRMIQEMLEFARLGGHTAGSASCEAAPVIQAVVQDFSHRLEGQGITLTTRLEVKRVGLGEVPFRMIIANLVDNSIKYMGEGETRTIVLSTDAAGSGIVLVVKDSGLGISDQVMPRLFEPYFRGRTAGTGYGLGLATVKKLVEAHGGRVAIDSSVGQGTTATVTLPAPRVA